MSSQIYSIQKKKKWLPEAFASIRDFRLRKDTPVDTERLRHAANLSLYCADFEHEQIVFVETPENITLSAFPFLYLAQYEHAVRVITVPFAELHRLADELPGPEHSITVLYTVGRAGSTLLSKMFECNAATVSLSEPDIMTDFVMPLKAFPGRAAEIEKLFLACMKLLLSSRLTHGKNHILVKPRGVCIEMWQTIHQALPQSKVLFLYRHARPVIESYMRAFLDRPMLYPLVNCRPAKILLQLYVAKNKKIRLCFPSIDSRQIKAIGSAGIPGFILAAWLSIMKAYAGLLGRAESLAVRYEDIIAHPREITAQLFDYCAIPTGSVDRALEAMQQDSQQGTRMSAKTGRERRRLNRLISMDNLDRILQHEREITAMDYTFPGTLRPLSR